MRIKNSIKSANDLRVQVLMSTVGVKDFKTLIRSASLKTPAIIINQCDSLKCRSIGRVKIFNFPERGVGLSRNNALMRADADIVLIADEDEKYVNGYENIVKEEFALHPKADVIIFNVKSENPKRPAPEIKKFHRVNKMNGVRYAASRFAIKIGSQRDKNVWFSVLFGGGAKYGCGEDSLFIKDCLAAGMKVYASPRYIGSVAQQNSTWFNGYNDKFFYDKGVLYRHISPNFAKLRCVIFLFRNRERIGSEYSFSKAFSIMKKGIKNE